MRPVASRGCAQRCPWPSIFRGDPRGARWCNENRRSCYPARPRFHACLPPSPPAGAVMSRSYCFSALDVGVGGSGGVWRRPEVDGGNNLNSMILGAFPLFSAPRPSGALRGWARRFPWPSVCRENPRRSRWRSGAGARPICSTGRPPTPPADAAASRSVCYFAWDDGWAGGVTTGDGPMSGGNSLKLWILGVIPHFKRSVAFRCVPRRSADVRYDIRGRRFSAGTHAALGRLTATGADPTSGRNILKYRIVVDNPLF